MNENGAKGLVIVNTGYGKGKTTAALGIMMRGWAQNWKMCAIQFIKRPDAVCNEMITAQQLGVEWHRAGDGFTWTTNDKDETIAKALYGWILAQERIGSGQYDLILLDEFTYALEFGWINTNEVIGWLRAHKPPKLHLLITGRDAPIELVEYADLVTDMRKVKHPFDQGILAQPGIEF
ncbi:MAG: cob(I)yrinic acid a,c-diamide adenosyltransferase [Chloroflexi bacterium]|nr:cob(I)yrinic acid a,c-diamide adenosyltransferase [Chloroflexota bacterium]